MIGRSFVLSHARTYICIKVNIIKIAASRNVIRVYSLGTERIKILKNKKLHVISNFMTAHCSAFGS